MDPIFFKSFHIAGFTYYQGVYVFQKLEIGTKLNLRLDENNIHDDFAVEIYFEDKKLGYVPRNQNQEISILLKAGYDIFDCVVQQISVGEHPEEQVRVAVFVRPAEKSKD